MDVIGINTIRISHQSHQYKENAVVALWEKLEETGVELVYVSIVADIMWLTPIIIITRGTSVVLGNGIVSVVQKEDILTTEFVISVPTRLKL